MNITRENPTFSPHNPFPPNPICLGVHRKHTDCWFVSFCANLQSCEPCFSAPGSGSLIPKSFRIDAFEVLACCAPTLNAGQNYALTELEIAVHVLRGMDLRVRLAMRSPRQGLPASTPNSCLSRVLLNLSGSARNCRTICLNDR